MRPVVLASESDFDGWRAAARELLRERVAPERVVWRVADDAQQGLFDGAPAGIAAAASAEGAPLRLPRRFVELAREAACHGERERFAVLYRLAWRLAGDARILHMAMDEDVHRVTAWAKAVRRDKHKMTAFVRFREVAADDGSWFVAWFEPEHHIVEATAPFFMRRFTGMRWSILTPRRSVHWDGGALSFGSGAAKAQVPDSDRLEDYWRTYFASIFNPARLKVAAMTREMPRKYWRNLPEAEIIGPLIRQAGGATAAMIAAPASARSRHAGAVAARQRAGADRRRLAMEEQTAITTLEQARRDASGCRRCPLWKDATQTVFGEGPQSASLMLVGEQPGDKEDLAGRPFVGPAGELLDRALGEAGIARDDVYVTNAVKHFKFEPRGKRRLHKRPDSGEIEACRWWLDLERRLVRPRLVVALGASAAHSLLGRKVTISRLRGQALEFDETSSVWITVHPSYLLRLPDPAAKREQYAKFVADLADARQWLAQQAAA